MMSLAFLALVIGGAPPKATPIIPRSNAVCVVAESKCVCTDRGGYCVCPNGDCQCDDCPTRAPSTPRPASNGFGSSCKVGQPSNAIDTAEDGEGSEGNPVWCKRLETPEGVMRNVWLYPDGKWARPFEPARHDLFRKEAFASSAQVKTFSSCPSCPGGVCPR